MSVFFRLLTILCVVVSVVFIILSGVVPDFASDDERVAVISTLGMLLLSSHFACNGAIEREDDKEAREEQQKREEAEWMERVSYLKVEDRVWLEGVGFDTTGLPTRQGPEKTDGFATGMARAFAKGLLGHRTVR